MKESEFSPEVKATVDGRAMWTCEVCGEGDIAEYHHRRPRGSGGSKRADTGGAANCLGLCRNCHRMIESNRTVARVMGWLVPQGWAPADAKVIYRGEVRWLHDDGEVTSEPTAFV